MSIVSLEERDDEQLMVLIVQQSREALESLYDRYSRAVYSLAVSLLRDPSAAEEVTQDAFLSVWRRGASYRPKRGKVTAWLFSIAHHRTIDEIRRRRRELEHVREGVDVANEPSTGMDDPLEYATAQYERSRLKGALATLRPEQRTVVVLSFFGGLTHAEIVGRLRQPLGTVKTRIRLGLRRMREALGPEMQEQGGTWSA